MSSAHFPDRQSCLDLAAARLRYIAGTAWSTKRVRRRISRMIRSSGLLADFLSVNIWEGGVGQRLMDALLDEFGGLQSWRRAGD